MLGKVLMSQESKDCVSWIRLISCMESLSLLSWWLFNGFKHFSATAPKGTVPAQPPRGLPPAQPMALEPHFSLTWGCWSLPQRCSRGACLQPHLWPYFLGGCLGPALLFHLWLHLLLLLTGLDSPWTWLFTCLIWLCQWAHYQHLAIGAVPFDEGKAHAGVTHGCPSLLEQLALSSRTLIFSLLLWENSHIVSARNKSSLFFPL